ncbi:MAG: valine--tRNA ligase [Candidatus Woesearchaeota archaeon]|jgi:valyl-tRNA synthetase|nr:valine--tRNA ligase [Candidatus Woesearchaeota archaeon]MDP7180932.1 valine--tRNA ligase [Candidatus Woesearchaeota archaeon]MDP7199132.1 valine--tRNA ligase [Candidatus Woesearchaeota archaeon]MDP7467606.1 valine--tRNA ligase [Candidatus Woesearchaeota archaeon]MDP7647088.1 valine--tRNA ligase [Candidatus Woesearchaeota archaeon]
MPIEDKRWTKEKEESLAKQWRTSPYPFDKKNEKPLFSVDTPPPYVNAPVHMGHVTTYIIMDMIARFKRMTGHNVLFPLGLDRNGLPIEVAAEKKFKKKLTEVPREEAIEMCKKILEESSLASVESFARAGISFNSWKIGTNPGEIYLTDSDDYRALTQGTFIDMWKKGLIYEDVRTNNYCPGCQTTIADSEIEYEDKPTIFTDIQWETDTGEKIVIGTTRPELLCSCEAVLYHPNDQRYKHLEGKNAITPIYGRKVKIMAHPLAEMDKGTGLVMMCAFGDYTDIRFFREQKLTPKIAINKDGTLNQHAGKYEGKRIYAGRKAILEDLKEAGLIVEQRQIQHRTPVCDRSKDDVEFIELPEFYVKQLEFKDTLRSIAESVSIHAEPSRQILLDWIDSIAIDWPISRRRFYATEVPVWHCTKCKEIVLPPKGKYYQPWKEKSPVPCPKCQSTDLKGEERVFDTWFDSSISPLYILQYEKDDKFFRNNIPCSLRPQGKEIVRTWLYYTLLKCFHLTNKTIFKDVWIHYHVVDDNGKKMSKSVGNIIDPQKLLDDHGAESLRLWAATEGDLSKGDIRCSDERIKGAGKTLTKLWNVARFVSSFPEGKEGNLEPLDEWILDELNTLIALANEKYAHYDFFTPALALRHFVWETFASHYLELAKNRAYNNEDLYTDEEANSARYTLHTVLSRLTRLFAPILPMVTYEIVKATENKDVHQEAFPKVERTYQPPFKTEELMETNGAIWKAKQDKGISLKAEVKKATLPKSLQVIEKDIKHTHTIGDITYGDTFAITL